jgi:type IV secretion system protein VirB10
VSGQEPAPDGVEGERARSAGTRVRSVQSRVSNAVAIGLMSILGLGALTWYYASAMTRQGRARESAQAASAKRAQGDLPLPSLGRIAPPPPLPGLFEPLTAADAPREPPPRDARTLAEIAVAPASGPPAKTPEQTTEEREMSGSVFAAQGASSAGGGVDRGSASPSPLPANANAGDEPGTLATLLRPSVTSAARAQVLPAQRLLLPKGAFIDCTLETAIDSTLPGMTTCVMASDAFGVDGKVVLLERGTKLIGETRGQVRQGSARIFVLWTEARTPAGIVVPLDSPGADELGRSGLPGEVNSHFWQRFGAALLVSVIDGAVQAAAESPHNGGGTVIVNPSASQDVLTEILKNTIGIPPTVVKRNGDRIQVLVARDVDFRSVYELRSVAPAP